MTNPAIVTAGLSGGFDFVFVQIGAGQTTAHIFFNFKFEIL